MEEIKRKGIILAGGVNSRLYPVTQAIPKSLLPVYDKPLIYYSLSVLMLAGLRDMLIITTPEGEEAHRRLLGDGAQFGVCFSYLSQDKPRGIADAFIIARDFIGECPCALILADNIFYGGNLVNQLRDAAKQKKGAVIFAYQVPDPERFGVVEFDENGRALSLEEKPQNPKSKFAVTGCYFYDENVCDFADTLKPSARGELEITDINRLYMQQGQLSTQRLGRGLAWFDTGTPDSLAQASDFVRVIQKQQGLMIACPEEIAWRQGWLDDDALAKQSDKTFYGNYLRKLVENLPS